MTTHELCTYFDSGYLSRALVLHDSLVATGLDFRLTALCLDSPARDAVQELGVASFRALGLPELEDADPALRAVRPTRTTHEYYFTLGPSLMRYLLERDGPDHLTYLDADMCFYSSPQPLFDESVGAATVIVGHRFPDRLRHLEETGRFNVAWVGFDNQPAGLACLEWWRERCLEWCFDRVEDHRYADQKYLDEFPLRFERVHELQHPGTDVAPWNVDDPPLEWDGQRFTVGGQPLIFFHFQGFRHVGRFLADPNLAVYGNRATPAVARLCRQYARKLQSTSSAIARVDAPRRPHPERSLRARLLLVRSVARRQLVPVRTGG